MKLVIVHGSFGKPHENWIPWLEEELDKIGIGYLTPTFPTPNHQNYADWEKVLNLYYQFGLFGDDTTFVGHSCGAIFLAKYIVKNHLNCQCYISASGYNNYFNNDEVMDALNASFYLPTTQLQKIQNFARKRVAIHSNNDPFIPQQKLKEFCETIKAETHVVQNGGHLNAGAGFTTFELLLDIIKHNT